MRTKLKLILSTSVARWLVELEKWQTTLWTPKPHNKSKIPKITKPKMWSPIPKYRETQVAWWQIPAGCIIRIPWLWSNSSAHSPGIGTEYPIIVNPWCKIRWSASLLHFMHDLGSYEWTGMTICQYWWNHFDFEFFFSLSMNFLFVHALGWQGIHWSTVENTTRFFSFSFAVSFFFFLFVFCLRLISGLVDACRESDFWQISKKKII